jgi:hypothetical protein
MGAVRRTDCAAEIPMNAPFDDHLPAYGDTLQELMDEVASLSCRICDMSVEDLTAFRNEMRAERRKINGNPDLLASVRVYCTLISMCNQELEYRGAALASG